MLLKFGKWLSFLEIHLCFKLALISYIQYYLVRVIIPGYASYSSRDKAYCLLSELVLVGCPDQRSRPDN